jgi:hypothetical protein
MPDIFQPPAHPATPINLRTSQAVDEIFSAHNSPPTLPSPLMMVTGLTRPKLVTSPGLSSSSESASRFVLSDSLRHELATKSEPWRWDISRKAAAITVTDSMITRFDPGNMSK